AALAGVTRPPSRLPLFPYTTLFRSEGVDVGPRQLGDAAQDALLLGHGVPLVVGAARLFQTTVAGATAGSEAPAPAAETAAPAERSEEHTSELQSRENLVCRLLLEKK